MGFRVQAINSGNSLQVLLFGSKERLMGALPNTSPRPSIRKPAAKAVSNEAPDIRPVPRDLAQIDADFRGPAGTAWTPVPRTFDADRFRLNSGATFWGLTSYILHECAKDRRPNAAVSYECQIDIAETAALLRVAERSVNRELAYLTARDMAIVARLAGGKAVVRLVVAPELVNVKTTEGTIRKQYPGWAAIKQSYQEWAAAQRVSLEEQAEETEDTSTEEAPVKRGVVPVTRSPRKLKPGKQEKPVPVTTGVKAFRMDLVESDELDVSYTAAVHSGEFVATVCVPKRQNAQSKTSANRTESTTSATSSGHTRPNAEKVPANAGIVDHPQSGVDFTVGKMRTAEVVAAHSRAGELSAIFDPVLYSHCKKTLSGVPAILKQACEAIKDTPHDFLVDALEERAERKLLPNHVVSLLLEIRHNYLKSKDMPVVSKKAGGPSLLSPKAAADLEMYKALNEAKRRAKK
jgi:hypothetical protein